MSWLQEVHGELVSLLMVQLKREFPLLRDHAFHKLALLLVEKRTPKTKATAFRLLALLETKVNVYRFLGLYWADYLERCKLQLDGRRQPSTRTGWHMGH